MKLWRFVTMIAAILLLCFVSYTLGSLSSGARAATSTVEYKIVDVDLLPGVKTVKTLEAEFNRMGSQGWQLVQWDRAYATFRRP